jgi:hypothetical protein
VYINGIQKTYFIIIIIIIIIIIRLISRSLDSTVGIATGYGLDLESSQCSINNVGTETLLQGIPT